MENVNAHFLYTQEIAWSLFSVGLLLGRFITSHHHRSVFVGAAAKPLWKSWSAFALSLFMNLTLQYNGRREE